MPRWVLSLSFNLLGCMHACMHLGNLIEVDLEHLPTWAGPLFCTTTWGLGVGFNYSNRRRVVRCFSWFAFQGKEGFFKVSRVFGRAFPLPCSLIV